MSIEGNEALVRRCFEAYNKNDLDTLFKPIAPGYVCQFTIDDLSVEQYRQFWSTFSVAFPDAKWIIDDMVAEGDRVAIRETLRTTHQGEYLGKPATGNKIEMKNTYIIRIADGKVAEFWCN